MGSIVTALALPSYQTYLERSRRGDAVVSLNLIQKAQALHHAQHGRFATRIDQLPIAVQSLSEQGLYRIAMYSDGPDNFEARAQAVPDRAQAKDPGCAQVTLRVVTGQVSYEPSIRCWAP